MLSANTPSSSQAPAAADVELIEAEAWAELQLNLPADFRTRLRVSVQRRNRAVLLIAGKSPTLTINRVIGLGLVTPLTEKELDEIVHVYSSSGVERFIVQWSPAAEPVVARDWFIARGFIMLPRPITKMYRRAGSTHALIADPLLTVTEIGLGNAQTFEDVVAGPLGVPEGLGTGIRSTIGLPGWRYYLVRDGHRPIAGAALCVKGRMGWCGLGATVESDRRRGAQAALLARRLHDAAADGCEWVTTDTLAETVERANQSHRNMTRAGFTILYDRPNYLLDLRTSR
ncbi:MAG: hypothetical protein ABI664_12425 [bacterium]